MGRKHQLSLLVIWITVANMGESQAEVIAANIKNSERPAGNESFVSNITDEVVEREWMIYLKKYPDQTFDWNEQLMRKKFFADNLRYVEKHNYEFRKGNRTHTVSINKFAHMALDEFMKKATGFRISSHIPSFNTSQPKVLRRKRRFPFPFPFPFPLHSSPSPSPVPVPAALPPMVDWTTKGVVTPVKNQLPCACCWAFSATGALEGLHSIMSGSLVSLSEQNLIDCAQIGAGYGGCTMGAEPLNGFQYVQQNAGINSESIYPYTAVSENCKYNSKQVSAATCNGYVMLPSGNETALQEAVASIGPISVAIDANHLSFQLYESGVYSEPACSSSLNALSHAVLVVGYGTTPGPAGQDYWIIKNSWSSEWGDNGYIMLARNRNNECGVATRADYPIL